MPKTPAKTSATATTTELTTEKYGKFDEARPLDKDGELCLALIYFLELNEFIPKPLSNELLRNLSVETNILLDFVKDKKDHIKNMKNYLAIYAKTQKDDKIIQAMVTIAKKPASKATNQKKTNEPENPESKLMKYLNQAKKEELKAILVQTLLASNRDEEDEKNYKTNPERVKGIIELRREMGKFEIDLDASADKENEDKKSESDSDSDDDKSFISVSSRQSTVVLSVVSAESIDEEEEEPEPPIKSKGKKPVKKATEPAPKNTPKTPKLK